MIEAWKNAISDKGAAFAILTNFSKAFYCLNHDLLIAKLEAYGFRKAALKFIHDYQDKKQRTIVNGAFSSRVELMCGVPLGSILAHYYSTYSLIIFTWRMLSLRVLLKKHDETLRILLS